MSVSTILYIQYNTRILFIKLLRHCPQYTQCTDLNIPNIPYIYIYIYIYVPLRAGATEITQQLPWVGYYREAIILKSSQSLVYLLCKSLCADLFFFYRI
jgi:hypothetical protein